MSTAKMIEEKHRFRQGLIMRNRAYATLVKGDPDSDPGNDMHWMLAKGSVSPPSGCDDQNGYMCALYMGRRPGQRTMTHPFVSVRDQWVKEQDVFRLDRETMLNLEYDFKRRPVRPRMMPAGETMHLAFDTQAWETAEQGLLVRQVFDGWRETRCLKTMQDFEDFEDTMLTALAFVSLRGQKRRVPVNITADGSVGVLKRMFLRAYTQGLWGIVKSKSYPEVAAVLSRLGSATSVNDVKNAIRAKAYEAIVPKAPRAVKFMAGLVSEFVGVDPARFFFEEGGK